MSAPEPERAGVALCLRLFGPFALCRAGKPLPRVRTRQGHWLLALLALRQGQEVERSWLAGTLWPESSGPLAYHSLRSSLADLRRCVGEDAGRLRCPTPHTLCLDLAGVEVDVLAFDAAIAQGDPASLAAAVELYRGPLLEECTEPWAFQERQAREQTYLAARERLAALALERGDAAAAERHLRLAVAVDPLRESTQRALMQVLAAGGNFAAALLCYRELRLHLHRELNAQPDAETQTLYHQLRSEALRLSAKGTGFRVRGSGMGYGSAAPASERDLAMAPDRPADFAPLDRLDAPPHNLPVQRSPLIGREKEVARALELLRRDETGLLTMTGAGGSGKTRLGLQVAADLLPEFEHGVFLVGLAPIRDPSLVPSAIAQTLGVREVAGMPLLENLKAHLKDKQLLLLLDNFEQVLAAAPLVAELLGAAPRLKVLITSRAALHLRGEKEFLVPPLAVPGVQAFRCSGVREGPTSGPEYLNTRTPEHLTQYAAVELFIQRAQDVKPELAVTNENASAIAEICARLDGLPLAIELAAARIKLLPPQALLTRLVGAPLVGARGRPQGSPLHLLTGGARDMPARQQTLRDAIAWSYNLLEEPEKKLFRRLAVFAGGCTLEGAEAACNADGDLGIDVLEGMASLIDKSLLQHEQYPSGEARFTMLETIREYGMECLSASGEADAIPRQHAEFFLALAEEAAPDLWRDAAWLDRLETEHGNLRAALTWCQYDASGGEMGLRLATALFVFWYVRDHQSEGWRSAPGALAHPGAAARTTARGRTLYAAAMFAGGGRVGPEERRRLSEESLSIAREVGDQRVLASVLRHLGQVAQHQGDLEAAWRLTEESLTVDQEADFKWGIAADLGMLGVYAKDRGDNVKARAFMDESVALLRKMGNTGLLWPVLNRVCLAVEEGDFALARPLARESLAQAHEAGSRSNAARLLDQLARMATSDGDYAVAKAFWDESPALFRELGDRHGIKGDLEGLAGLAAARGETERAACLWGANAALREALGECPLDERRLAAVRSALGAEAFAAAGAEGRAMPLDQAVEYALEHAAPDRPELAQSNGRK